eukprot:1708862-Pyramimonas_sp.AAC.2
MDYVDERPRALAAHGFGSALVLRDRADAMETWNLTSLVGQDKERHQAVLFFTEMARDRAVRDQVATRELARAVGLLTQGH